MNKLEKLWKKYLYYNGVLFVPKTINLRPDGTKTTASKSFYDIKLKSSSGETIDFKSFKGKKVIVVNIASKCAYTGQYDELEKLYQTYKDKLVILGIPSNSFAQEPLGSEGAATSCRMDYGVTFPIFEKTPIKGSNQNELYEWLSNPELNGWNKKSPKWNFYKYLINENGDLMGFYSSGVVPTHKKLVKFL
jgi:glutathione peroxidase